LKDNPTEEYQAVMLSTALQKYADELEGLANRSIKLLSAITLIQRKLTPILFGWQFLFVGSIKAIRLLQVLLAPTPSEKTIALSAEQHLVINYK
jgi:hypothetical protein